MAVESTRRVVVALTLVAFTGASCSTAVQVALPQATAAGSAAPTVAAGDRVRVTLRDGTRVDGSVEALTPESITVGPHKSGTTQRILWADVTKVERMEISGGKTTALALTLGIVAVLGALFLVFVGTDGDFM